MFLYFNYFQKHYKIVRFQWYKDYQNRFSRYWDISLWTQRFNIYIQTFNFTGLYLNNHWTDFHNSSTVQIARFISTFHTIQSYKICKRHYLISHIRQKAPMFFSSVSRPLLTHEDRILCKLRSSELKSKRRIKVLLLIFH